MSEITAVQAVAEVMKEVSSVGKEGFNSFDKYNFRGIDGVMNAVGPALRKHGVVTIPLVEEIIHGTTTTGKGAVMTQIRLKMRLQWYGPAGDHVDTVVWGEAFDRGDKATAKAHSVAYRTAVLQTLCLPTQEPDPDESSYEQGQRDMNGAEREKYVQDFAEKLLATEKAGDLNSLQGVLKWATDRSDGELVRMTQQTIQRLQQAQQAPPVVDGEVMPDGPDTA